MGVEGVLIKEAAGDDFAVDKPVELKSDSTWFVSRPCSYNEYNPTLILVSRVESKKKKKKKGTQAHLCHVSVTCALRNLRTRSTRGRHLRDSVLDVQI